MTAATTTDRPGQPVVEAGFCGCGCGERTPLAVKTSRRDGWLRGEPLRFIHGHNARRSGGTRGRDEHVRLGRRPVWREHVLDEWVRQGGPAGEMPWARFPEHVGTTLTAWQTLFRRARNAGDPRATRPAATADTERTARLRSLYRNGIGSNGRRLTFDERSTVHSARWSS